MMSAAVRRLIRRGLRRVRGVQGPDPDDMSMQGLEEEISEMSLPVDPMAQVRMSQGAHERSMLELTRFVGQSLRSMGLHPPDDLRSRIDAFRAALKTNPARLVEYGATGDDLNLWLFVLAQSIAPSSLVESGVFVGRSLHALWSACPDAEIHAFDLSFDSLKFRHPDIHYHEYDWSRSEVRANGVGFCYFDDHINNGRRIREAYDRGFRHLVFDQCPPVGQCHLYRYPGLPSAVMIADRSLAEGDVIEWEWRDTRVRYRHRASNTHGSEDLIDAVHLLPSLARWSGRVEGPAAYVRLKE